MSKKQLELIKENNGVFNYELDGIHYYSDAYDKAVLHIVAANNLTVSHLGSAIKLLIRNDR